MQYITPEQIEEAARLLAEGGTLIFPTETSYGLGCDATNGEAVANIFAIKGRPDGKGLPVLVDSIEQAKQHVEWSDACEELAQAHWPGALNIVAPRRTGATMSERCAQDDFQSVRVSSHPFVQALLKKFGKPITATSANLSGEQALYSTDHAEELFKASVHQPDAVVDAGVLERRPASTTVKVEGEKVTVLRQGKIRI